ncbi:MAG: T9SS type A sorting domain-containing protein, partial [Candidatus Marinimicrobia bacterium]|nr:T9SS type A sorting domain-containing protein [Candidatus Neomarinimicrobiota bacterium]
HYVVAEQAPDDATGISVRARFTSSPTGTAWFDNFSAMKMVVATPTVVVSVDDGNESYQIPTEYALAQNYPNPFNPQTIIEFAIPHTGWINLTIYNLLGQKVRTLANGIHEQGRYRIIWDGRNELDQSVSSGMYIYSLMTDKTRITKKMLLLR